jgi:hypothetical protein
MDLTIKPLPENVISTVLRHAENGVADGTDPKAVIVDAVLDHMAGEIAFDLAATIKPAVEMQVMIFGNDHAQIVNAICDAQPEFAKLDATARLGMLAWNGDDLDIDTTLRAFVKASIPAPLPMNRGKWLAKAGIVKAHIDAIVPAGARVADAPADAPPPPPAAPAAEFDMAAMLGTAPAAPPPAPPGYGAVATQAAPAPAPEGNDVRNAIIMFADALDMKDVELAQRLGISRSTLHNMVSGKTQRVKCSLEQARVFLAEIDTRIGKLNAAADTFRQVR